MSRLSSISIENIKGIATKNFCLDLYPNKPAVLVAPNGFGKSSIACASKALNNNRIALTEKDQHNGNASLQPKITILLDAASIEATGSSNHISSEFDVFVINSPIYAKATSRNMGGFSSSSASLEVEPVVLIDTIPAKQDFDYSAQSFKTAFGSNGKILPNAEALLNNREFIYSFDKLIDKQNFIKVRTFKNPVASIRDKINAQSGTADSIRSWVKSAIIGEFEAIAPLKELAIIIQKYCNADEVDSYLLAYQVALLVETTSFSKAVNYHLHLRDKLFFDELLQSLNSTRHDIKTKEVKYGGGKKRLEVSFPKADEVSNGQRDILSFIAQIQRAHRKFSKKKCLLIIDEIFDYLDDANLVAFQYYITLLIEEFKDQGRSLYPILLTHLDPRYFNHFCFNRHKLQVRYLAKIHGAAPSVFLKLVQHREHTSIKDLVGRHYFHFHPEEKDLENEFQSLGLRKSWAKSYSFYQLVNEELTKYLQSAPHDSIGVLLAIRIKIEQIVYQQLTDEAQQAIFLDKHTTKNKLEYCESECRLQIPETYYLLGIIYNDDLHWRDGGDYETPLQSRLANPTIKKMIQAISERVAFNSSSNPADASNSLEAA